jgi:rare lipoprotein A (peptidoglycan hydrolase)
MGGPSGSASMITALLVAGRVVDLSYAAARQLDMVYAGVTHVKIAFLAMPWPGHSRSQDHLPEPSVALPLGYDTSDAPYDSPADIEKVALLRDSRP